MVANKVSGVPDSTCQGCSQCWDGECRAFLLPHSVEEYDYRTGNGTHGGRMACTQRAQHATPYPEVVQAEAIPLSDDPHEYLVNRPLQEVVDGC
jgi:hypothetical protein